LGDCSELRKTKDSTAEERQCVPKEEAATAATKK